MITFNKKLTSNIKIEKDNFTFKFYESPSQIVQVDIFKDGKLLCIPPIGYITKIYNEKKNVPCTFVFIDDIELKKIFLYIL